jgi:hypothetical protein
MMAKTQPIYGFTLAGGETDTLKIILEVTKVNFIPVQEQRYWRKVK